MTVITMSRSEIDRMSVLRDLAEDRIRVSEAARLMGLGRRQVLRLAKAYRQRGPTALVSNRRGNRSNRSYPKRVMVVDYPDGRLAIRHNGVDLPYRPLINGSG
jgi:hypothetical protein